jgi:hypothetical protein
MGMAFDGSVGDEMSWPFRIRGPETVLLSLVAGNVDSTFTRWCIMFYAISASLYLCIFDLARPNSPRLSNSRRNNTAKLSTVLYRTFPATEVARY